MNNGLIFTQVTLTPDGTRSQAEDMGPSLSSATLIDDGLDWI